MRDPYAVLGVKRDADASEIKSAWRSIAKKIHPDQNRSDPNAARRFAEAGAAYEVLKDPKKRSRYDMLSELGKEATIQQQREAAREAEIRRKAAEENARKVMEELARAEAEKARKAAESQSAADRASAEKARAQQSASQNGQQQQQAKGGNGDAERGQAEAGAGETPEDVIDRIFGAQPQFTVSGEQAGAAETERNGAASGAPGSRPLPLAAMEAISSFIRRLTGGPQSEKAPDQFAEAKITIEDMLKENWVTVALPEGRDLRFRLDPGVTDGQVIRLKGQGYKVPGLIRGDAVITLRVEPSPLFRVSGHDIHTALPVTLEDAVLGCTAQVETPTGPVYVDVPAWSGSDQVIRVPGLGLLDGKGGRGDLVAEVRILLWEKPDAKVTDLMRSMREGLYL
jgi:DnaJ-class molecular chaperone